jgi:hypothetical protein
VCCSDAAHTTDTAAAAADTSSDTDMQGYDIAHARYDLPSHCAGRERERERVCV